MLVFSSVDRHRRYDAAAAQVSTIERCRAVPRQDRETLFRYIGRRFLRRRAKQPNYLMDIVYIRDIKIECLIGVWDWERRIKQSVRIDLEMSADAARAARSDRIDETVDYKAVTKRVVEFASASEFQLVETLAEKISEIVRQEFNVPWIRVRANKRGALRDAGDVGVIIERGDPKSAPRFPGDR